MPCRNGLLGTCVDKLKAALAEYVEGRNGNPLVIDKVSLSVLKRVEALRSPFCLLYTVVYTR